MPDYKKRTAVDEVEETFTLPGLFRPYVTGQ